MKKDESTTGTNESLLTAFKEFEIAGNQIFGGTITGCEQNGTSTTYEFNYSCDNQYTFHNDSAGMCAAVMAIK